MRARSLGIKRMTPITVEAIVERLRLFEVDNTTWLPDHKIYRECNITLRSMDPNDLMPCQSWLVKRTLTRLEALRAQVRLLCDIQNMMGGLLVDLESRDRPMPVLPPIVELHVLELEGPLVACASVTESDKPALLETRTNQPKLLKTYTAPLIVDGMHRCYQALKTEELVGCLVIEYPPVPYYARPLENGWDDVTVVDIAPPSSHQWKAFTDPEAPLAFYRDFNKVFPGIQPGR